MQGLTQTAIRASRAAEGLRCAQDRPVVQSLVEVDAPGKRRHAALLTPGQRLGPQDRSVFGLAHGTEHAR